MDDIMHEFKLLSECEKFCKTLLETEFQSCNDKNEMLLHFAENGHLEGIKCLIEHQVATFNCVRNSSGDSVLKIAAENGNTQVVEYLISKGANIDQISGDVIEETALSAAVRKGYIDTAMSLIKLGAKIDILYLLSITNDMEIFRFILLQKFGVDESVNETHPSIELMRVCRNDVYMQLESLVNMGADINYQDEHSMTPLAYAIQSANIEAAKSLVNLGANTDIEKDLLRLAVESQEPEMVRFVSKDVLGISKLNIDDPRPSIAFHEAASMGLHWCIRTILSEMNVDIDYKSEDGSTPLLAATRNGHAYFVDRLLELGANVEVEIDGKNVMDIAIEEKNIDLIGVFAVRGLTTKKIDAKQFASSKDIRQEDIFKSIPVVKWLVCNGANVDTGIDDNDTALLRAVESNRIEMARALIELGASIDIKSEGKNLLEFALHRRRSLNIIDVLLEAGLSCQNWYPPDTLLITTLWNAAHSGISRVVRYLVLLMQDLEMRPRYSRAPKRRKSCYGIRSNPMVAPLFESVRSGRVEIASLLIDLGAKPNIVIGGLDLLDVAIESNSVDMIETILGYGFDINGLNPNKRPYLTVAVQHDSEEVMKFLFDKGVDYWAYSEPDRRTAMWFCSSAYKINPNAKSWPRGCMILLNHVRKRDGKEAMISYMNHQDAKGQTALHFFCQNGDYDLVLESLFHGHANPNIEDENLKRPQDLAECEDIKILFEEFDRINPNPDGSLLSRICHL